MLDLSEGQLVADKYRIDGVIGSGGMGVVVAATHVELEQRVAIKLLRDASDEGIARFRREARLLVRLKNPHVARVFDVGTLDDETPYIVMELLEGKDLSAILDERGKLPVEEAVDYVLQAMCAVAEAHASGMVHRDLKPANLFVARGPGGAPTVKVLDFGVSKILDDRAPDRDLTNEGVALGSPGYMAPEQMSSARDVDARADVFALGALLYRLVGGRTPWKGGSIVSVLASMATEPPAPLATLVPDLPPGFDAIVSRCLAQDPNARWASVAPLADGLAPYASRRGRAAVEEILATLGVGGDTTTTLQYRTSKPSVPPPRAAEAFSETRVQPLSAPPPKKKTGSFVAGALLLVAGIAAGAAFVIHANPNAAANPNANPNPSPSPSPTPSAIPTPTEPSPVAATPTASAPIATATATGPSAGAPGSRGHRGGHATTPHTTPTTTATEPTGIPPDRH